MAGKNGNKKKQEAVQSKALGRHFPEIMVSRSVSGYEAVAGLKLAALLKRELLEEGIAMGNADNAGARVAFLKGLLASREGLVHALSAWPEHVTMELHLTTVPDLVDKAGGKVMISLFLKACSANESKAREEVVSRYLMIRPLLASHMPEAEFLPITNRNELTRRLQPFHRTHSKAICRQNQMLVLSAPLKRLTLGFGPMALQEIESRDDVVSHLFSFVPSEDDWSCLLDTLSGQLDPLQIVIRIRPKPPSEEVLTDLTRVIRSCERFIKGVPEYRLTLNQQAGLIRDAAIARLAQLRNGSFRMGVFLLAAHPIDPSVVNVLGKSITRLADAEKTEHLFRGGFDSRDIPAAQSLQTDFFPENNPFTISETACAFRLPSPPAADYPGLPLKRWRSGPLNVSFQYGKKERPVELFVNTHRNASREVVMGTDDRMRHTFILGQTGTGKSTLMEHMILQDIRDGRGLALLDPHGELVESVLGKIPAGRQKDVVLFDMLEQERPVGFNLLEWRTLDERDLIIDELYLTLDRIYDMKQTGGPIFETNFRGMLKLLMGDLPRKDFVATILDFNSCYLNSDFREWLKTRTDDPQTHDFVNELERTGGEASLPNLSPYVTSKFSRFIHDTRLRRIVGQEKTGFCFEEIMNQGKIFLVNLGKGRFGSMASALLANQLVSRFKLAAMKRAEIRPEERREFYLYVDEAQNLPQENFRELLSEARKYRMGLILATQYAAQLQGSGNKDDDLLTAVLGNVGTLLIFRVGHEDASKLSPTLYPAFSALDIVGLPNWHGYARTQLHGEATPPFSFKTVMDAEPYRGGTARRVRTKSGKKYGVEVARVDEATMKRRRAWRDEA